MGRRGPPPKPSSLKDLHGTRRADREPRREPKPPPGRPSCPSHLGPVARAAWRHWEPILVAMGTLTVADRTMLELACLAYGEYRQAAELLAAKGPVVTISTGKGRRQVRANPAASAAADAWRRTVVGLRELGLTPAARTRIEADPILPAGTPPPPVTAPTRLPQNPHGERDEFFAGN